VGVGIDEGREDTTSGGVESLVRITKETAMLWFFSDKGDPPALAPHYCLGANIELCKVAATPRGTSEWRDHLVGAADEEAHP
jgi:hypothetical protein